MAAVVAHTPGPWTFDSIDDKSKRDPEFGHTDDASFWIAEDCHAGEVVAVVIRMPNDEQAAEANARLIAAAPDLLAACERAVSFLDENVPYGPEQPIFQQLAAAIKKARE